MIESVTLLQILGIFMKLHPVVDVVTQRIADRSQITRAVYLKALERASQRDRGPTGWAAPTWRMPWRHAGQRQIARGGAAAPNIAIITAYNDMLSAHAPLPATPT
jgi:phosphogluconate dehydratase